MTSERKVSASLNPTYETDQYILAMLPEKNISEVIKLALALWYEIQEERRIVIDRDEYDQLRQRQQAAAPVGMALDMPAITKAISDGVAQGIARAGIQGIASTPTNGNGATKPAPIDDEREDPNDPLVRAMMGLKFEDI